MSTTNPTTSLLGSTTVNSVSSSTIGTANAITKKQGATNNGIVPITPRLLDCLRTVFAAIIWHENGAFANLTQAANCHKAQPEILSRISHLDNWQRALFKQQNSVGEMPAQILHCITLWHKVFAAVMLLKNGGLAKFLEPPPELPTTIADLGIKSVNTGGASGIINLHNPTALADGETTSCELCEKLFVKPITTHMREKHAGCGGPSYSHG